MVSAINCMMARFPQQRGLVSALAVGLAMTTRVAAFRYDADAERRELCLAPIQHDMKLAWSCLTVEKKQGWLFAV